MNHFMVLAADDMGAIVGLVIYVLVLLVVVAGLWKTFAKAGQPGWAVLVPFYNVYVLTQVAGRPWWWMLLLLVPIVSIVIAFILAIDVAKAFGKGVGFGVGLALLPFIFYPILGFGSAEYQGPAR